MRFHCLSIPHTVTSSECAAWSPSQRALDLCKTLTVAGHEVIHYGHEDSDLECTTHVTVVTNEDFLVAYNSCEWRTVPFDCNVRDHVYHTYYKNAIAEIQYNKKKGDFIVPMWGALMDPVCESHMDLLWVNPDSLVAGIIKGVI